LYEVYVQAFRRYKNVYIKPKSFENFKKTILSSQDNDVWGVMNTKFNKLVAFSIVTIQGKEKNVASYNVIKLHPDFLKFYPSYALIFEMNRFYLNEKNFLYVHDGARSLGHETNIHDWLIEKFKFRKAYAKLKVVYRKDINLLASICYKIRRIIYFLEKFETLTLFKKLGVLCRHEEIRRECEEISPF
jgi:hypothetical protein